MSKITDAINQLDGNPNAKQILDSVLDKGIVTVGNQNDYINCLNKCYPNATPDQANDIFEQLEANVDEGTVCSYFLLDSSDEESVLSIPVTDKLFLNFYLKE